MVLKRPLLSDKARQIEMVIKDQHLSAEKMLALASSRGHEFDESNWILMLYQLAICVKKDVQQSGGGGPPQGGGQGGQGGPRKGGIDIGAVFRHSAWPELRRGISRGLKSAVGAVVKDPPSSRSDPTYRATVRDAADVIWGVASLFGEKICACASP